MTHKKIYKLYILSLMYVDTFNQIGKRTFSSLLFRKSYAVNRQIQSLQTEFKNICDHSNGNTPLTNESDDLINAIDLLFMMDEESLKESITFLTNKTINK